MDYCVEMNKAKKDIIYSATIFHDNIQNTSKYSIEDIFNKVNQVVDVTQYDNYFLKIVKDFPSEEYNEYKEVSEKFNFLVKVHGHFPLFKDPDLFLIVLEKHDNFMQLDDKLVSMLDNEKEHKEFFLYVMNEFTSWYVDMFKYFKYPYLGTYERLVFINQEPIDQFHDNLETFYFFHNDIAEQNVLCLDNDKLLLIDPESFAWRKAPHFFSCYNKSIQSILEYGFVDVEKNISK